MEASALKTGGIGRPPGQTLALRVLRDPALDGPTNMGRDECLLYTAETGLAVLRIYGWSASTISLGCFQRFGAVAELPEEVRGFPVVRRPTGGGAILHDREITYALVLDGSVAVPAGTRFGVEEGIPDLAEGGRGSGQENFARRASEQKRTPEAAREIVPRAASETTIEAAGRASPQPDCGRAVLAQPPVALYRVVHECWRRAIQAIAGLDRHKLSLAGDALPLPSPRTGPFFCFEKPGRTDVLLGSEKLVGSAQRRIPGRVLQHGSVLLGRRFAAHPGAHLGDPPVEAVSGMVGRFTCEIAAALGMEPRLDQWSAAELRDAEIRAARFRDPAWTQRH